METNNIDCHGVVIPSVDETTIPCDGLVITTDCITSTKAFNFFGTGIGEYLTVILDKISEKARLVSNLVNINTAAITAEVVRATAAENLKANIESPTLTGLPNAPTAAPLTNNTQIATTAYVDLAVAEDKQKTISYPGDFTGINYTLSNLDNGYSIIIDNGGTAVTITVPSGLVSKFQVGLIQDGSGNITITPAGTIIHNAISGYKIKSQYDQAYLEQNADSSVYYLFGNTKV